MGEGGRFNIYKRTSGVSVPSRPVVNSDGAHPHCKEAQPPTILFLVKNLIIEISFSGFVFSKSVNDIIEVKILDHRIFNG